jgi:hypothetical protein
MKVRKGRSAKQIRNDTLGALRTRKMLFGVPKERKLHYIGTMALKMKTVRGIILKCERLGDVKLKMYAL